MKKISLITILLLSSVFAFSQNIVQLNEKTFREKVWDFEKTQNKIYIGSTPAIIDFSAVWCQPCKLMNSNLKQIKKEYGSKLLIYKVDVDKNRDIAKLFLVRSVPTLLYAVPGKKFKVIKNFKHKDQLRKDIKNVLKVE